MKKISPLNKKHILFLTLTVLFVLVLSGAASAGTPLQENQTGTVSGDLYVNTTDGWPSSTQGATNEVTQANTLPAYTSIDSAWVYVNVYSGSGSANWPVRTTIKLDGNGDGDYDDPGELLGIEDMNIPGSTDGTVYWLNDHCNRVYSDYQVWYDVTGLITCNNPTLYVKTENMGGIDYDGRIKLLALTVAYNDGDTDQVHYWVLNGQDWINTATSPSTSTFNTSSFNGQVTSATLNTVALSGTDGTYTLNGNTLTDNLTETGTYYKEHTWDVTGNINTGANTTLTYTNVGSSLKMNFATLAIRETAVNNGLADTPWPKFGQNNQNTGQSEYNGPQTNNIIWTHSTGALIFGSAVIAADGTIYIGSDNCNFYALNSDGTLKWVFSTSDVIEGSAAIGIEGTIYIGSGDGNIYALNPDGTLKWTYTTGSSISSPVIDTDGTIYIGSDNGNTYALNPDGTLKWTCNTGWFVYGPLAIGADGTIYIGSGDGNIYALNPDGTLKWTYTTGISIYYNGPTIGADGTIYIGNNSGVFYAINPDGTLKWTYTTGEFIWASASIASDGTIYIGSTDGVFYALNPDGTLKWTYTAETEIRSTPSIATDGSIYFGDYNGKIYALNPDGTLKWTYTAGGRTYGLTIGADGIIYFGGYDNKIYALNPNGTLQWTFTTGNYIYGTPAIASDGTLYIGSRDGKLYAFKDAFAPIANFTSSITNGTEGYVPITMQFTDTSTYPASWSWDFGDGTSSTEKNPLHTYSIPGTYAVNLTVTNAAGNNTIVQNVVLNMPPVPVANFTADNVSGMGHLTVHFTDQSTGVNLSRAWDFNGDGITDSTEMNPTFTYTTVGNYTVKLTVSNIAGSSDEIKTDYISVLADTEAPTVVASPISTNYNPPMQVTLSATDNADLNPKIYYTTDNTDPTTSSTLYTGPINLSINTTLKFIAVDVNGNISPVQTETYTMVDTEAPNATATRNDTTITLSAIDNSDPNPAIYYTTNGDEPTTGTTPYSGPFTIPPAAVTVVKFIAVDASGNTSPVQSRSFNTTRSTDILTGYYAEGNVGVKAVLYGGYGWFAYNEPGTGTATFTPSSLNIPEGATILSARLYQSWTWRGYPEYTLQFNGITIPTTMHYVDGNDGQDFYDVTAYFNQNSDNTAILTATGGCSYATLLIVVYESSSEPYQKIWVNEGFDILYASSMYGCNPGPGHVYFNNVTTDNIASAQITAILPSGQGDGDTIIFNGQNFTTTSRIDSTDPAYAYFNILPALQNGTNEIEYPEGGYYSIQNAILTVTLNAPVAGFTADVVSGFAPLTVQFTDQSTDATGWSWDFDNNGTVDSTDQNPIWTFAAGTYTVKLTATGPGGSDDEIKTNLVMVDPSMVITNNRTNQIYTNIQDAITDALTLNGDTLTVHNGTYTENIYINKQLTFNTTGIVTVNAANPDLPIFTLSSAANGTILNGFILNGATNAPAIRFYSADNCQIIDNVITGNYLGVELYDCENNTLTGNNIHDNLNTGIYLSNCIGNNINNNTVTSNGVIGILLREANNNNLLGNTVTGNGWVGIALDNAENNNIGANNINGNQEGIHLTNSHNNIIDGNSITDNTNIAISLINGSTGNSISANTAISNNGIIGVYLRESGNNNISGNTIQNNGWLGICLDNATGNNINGANNISGNQEGIYMVNNSHNTTITNNNIHHNQDTGIFINQSHNTIITANTLTDNGVVGLLLREANNNTITGNTVTNNGWVGIILDHADNNLINGANNIQNNQIGIYLVNNCNTNTLQNNTIQNNTWAGLILDTAHNTKIYQNNFINNPLQALAINGTGNQFNHTTTGNHWTDWTNHNPRPINGNETTYDLYPSTTTI